MRNARVTTLCMDFFTFLFSDNRIQDRTHFFSALWEHHGNLLDHAHNMPALISSERDTELHLQTLRGIDRSINNTLRRLSLSDRNQRHDHRTKMRRQRRRRYQH
ncbi:hypothetical protein FOCC_FOCC002540 [Frankliniella occidentalis]|uniref:Uncharacterized protein LOC113205085 n=1 Tax=Frankliniella occidentalis TaxID=133901 RepID=A0A6J1SCF7_FRAOC|nr:uncharacterized protein LOC113205085 [Frankliniella occidentalis]KAE8750829.1 hypothetical protein FOCC_FOCC002540 [Frankliniella occidentalis]